MRKAISPMVATVLLIAFAVAVGGVVSMWLSSFLVVPEDEYKEDWICVKYETTTTNYSYPRHVIKTDVIELWKGDTITMDINQSLTVPSYAFGCFEQVEENTFEYVCNNSANISWTSEYDEIITKYETESVCVVEYNNATERYRDSQTKEECEIKEKETLCNVSLRTPTNLVVICKGEIIIIPYDKSLEEYLDKDCLDEICVTTEQKLVCGDKSYDIDW